MLSSTAKYRFYYSTVCKSPCCHLMIVNSSTTTVGRFPRYPNIRQMFQSNFTSVVSDHHDINIEDPKQQIRGKSQITPPFGRICGLLAGNK